MFDTSDPALVALFEDESELFDPEKYDKDKQRRKMAEDILAGGIEPDEEIDVELLRKVLDEKEPPKSKHLKGVETDAEKKAKYGEIDDSKAVDVGDKEDYSLFDEPIEGREEEAEDAMMGFMPEDGGEVTVGHKKVEVKGKGKKPVKAEKTEVKAKPVKVSTETSEDPFEAMAKEKGKRMTSVNDIPDYKLGFGLPETEPGVEQDEVTGGLLDLAVGGAGGLLRGGMKGLGKLLGRAGAKEAAGEAAGAGAKSSTPRLRFDLSKAPTGREMTRDFMERNARRAAEAGGPDSLAIRGAQTTRPGRLRLQYRDATNEMAESSDAARRFGGFGEMARSDAMRAAKRIVDQVKKLPHGRVNRGSIETQLRNLGLSDREILEIFPDYIGR